MRGEVDPQSALFSYISLEARVPVDHPLRAIKAYADAALRLLSGALDELYASTGRPSIPPERLLKGELLIALYSVRSDRGFCEQLDYNLLYRWFLDMTIDEKGIDRSIFSRMRERLIETEAARGFFEQVFRLARAHRLLSKEHFTADSALIESWISNKDAKEKAGAKSERLGELAPEHGPGPDVKLM